MKAYREQEGWKFYYSPEGYPYYYNELTGVSEWATDKSYYEATEAEAPSDPGPKRAAKAAEAEDEEEEDDDDDDEEESQGDDEESGSSLDEGLETKFRQYLRTPEGIAAVLEEQERITKYIDERQSRQEAKREEQYLKSLLRSKKYDGDASGASGKKSFTSGRSMALTSTLEAAWQWLTEKPPSAASNASASPAAQKPSPGRERRKRLGESLATAAAAATTSTDYEQGVTEDNHSDSEEDDDDDDKKDTDSLSSDDSDVAVINTPMFADLPIFMHWQFWETHVVTPSQQFITTRLLPGLSNQHRDNTATGDGTSSADVLELASDSSTASSAPPSPSPSSAEEWRDYLTQQTWRFAVQTATLAGEVSVTLAAAMFAQLQPYLVQFMEQVVDSHHRLPQQQQQQLQQQRNSRNTPQHTPRTTTAASSADYTTLPAPPPPTPRDPPPYPHSSTPRGTTEQQQQQQVSPRSSNYSTAPPPPRAPPRVHPSAAYMTTSSAAEQPPPPPSDSVDMSSPGMEGVHRRAVVDQDGWKQLSSHDTAASTHVHALTPSESGESVSVSVSVSEAVSESVPAVEVAAPDADAVATNPSEVEEDNSAASVDVHTPEAAVVSSPSQSSAAVAVSDETNAHTAEQTPELPAGETIEVDKQCVASSDIV